jgi:phage terminase large subunit
MNNNQEQELLQLLQQEEKERVSPKLEALRSGVIGGDCPDDVIFKGTRGGRGAGAKSWSLTSLLVQEAQYTPLRIACLREVQNSIAESVYELIEKTVDRLGYSGWKFTDSYIKSPCGSHFIFKGLRTMRASRNIKGLEGFTRFFIEEAAPITAESWDVLLPTLFRNEGAQLWFCYNPETEADPVTTHIWNIYKDNPRARLIEVRPGKIDNPWFNDTLQELSDTMKKIDPDLWEHVYGGKPRSQGDRAILPRTLVRAAMSRNIKNPEGETQVGVDPADFGDDKTEIYIRKGHKVIKHKELRKMNGTFIANEIWSMINADASIPIKVDTTGIGASTRDALIRLGAKVISIHFNGSAVDRDKYPNTISEMWFNFQSILPEIDIPDDSELMSDLSSRLYDYDTKGRRKVESKDNFKERYSRSPDKGDALLLCFYQGGVDIGNKLRQQMRKRRKVK